MNKRAMIGPLIIAVAALPLTTHAAANGACDIGPGTTLRSGASGSDVLCLEKALEDHGLLAASVVDGRFRSATSTAVKRLQRRTGVQRTGVADDTVFRALGILRPTLVNVTTSGRLVPGRPDVAVIGDSLTAQSAEAQLDALDASGYNALLVDGGLGRSIFDAGTSRESGIDAITRTAARFSGSAAPDAWVIALGTNDAGNAAFDRLGSYASRIRTVLAAIPGDAPVVWIGPAVQTSSIIRGREDEVAAFGRALHDVATDTPRLHILDWGGYAALPGILGSDGVHLTEPVGVEVRATAVTDAVITATP